MRWSCFSRPARAPGQRFPTRMIPSLPAVSATMMPVQILSPPGPALAEAAGVAEVATEGEPLPLTTAGEGEGEGVCPAGRDCHTTVLARTALASQIIEQRACGNITEWS